MSITKAQVTSVNDYLTPEQMETNGLYVGSFLSSHGWSVHAIAAILANMQAESGVNPGIYESLDSGSTTNGFGLVQWTPNTKFKTWADANGYAYGDIDGQLNRILYELENGLQWISTDTYPMTFEQFSKSDGDVESLTYAFMYNYERPASLDQPHRKGYATSWLSVLEGGGVTGGGSGSTTQKKKGLPLIFQYIATRM